VGLVLLSQIRFIVVLQNDTSEQCVLIQHKPFFSIQGYCAT
jgi:hypothetical protein